MAQQTARGFTLLEMATVMAITVVLAAMAVPSYNAMLARQRLQATAEHLRADIALARQEASRRASPVHLVFQPGARWCYAIGTRPAGDCQQATASPANGLIKVVRGTDQPGVHLLEATAMGIDSRTGGSLGPGGLARFASAAGQQVQVRLGAMGHASICAPDGSSNGIAGLPPCPPGPAGR